MVEMEGITLKKGTKVWIRNPYLRSQPPALPLPPSSSPSSPVGTGDGWAYFRVIEDMSSYRAEWLPPTLSAPPPFVPAEILEGLSEGCGLVVTTVLAPHITLSKQPNEVWPLNPVSGIGDCADFSFLHEPAVLYNLMRRFLEDRVVTRAGPVHVLINPCRSVLDGSGVSLLDPIYMARYRARVSARSLESMPPSKRAFFALPPHLYDIGDRAMTAMLTDLTSQSVVLLGPSGSGKSEAAKAILQYWLCFNALGEEGVAPEMLLSLAPNSIKDPRTSASATRAIVRKDFNSRDVGIPSLRNWTPAAAQGVPGGKVPLLLSCPDIEGARRDSIARSEVLGSACNPFVSQKLWAKRPLSAAMTSGTAYKLLPDASPDRFDGVPISFMESEAAVKIGRRLQQPERMLMAGTLVLENFGCASTPNNRNSSCHTKCVKMHFDSTGKCIGGFFTVGLLEKQRVARRMFAPAVGSDDTHGANFHVFRRMLAAMGKPQKSELHLLDQAEYAILAGDHTEQDTTYDAAEFEGLCNALTELGIGHDAQSRIWQILSGLLLAGNIRISEVSGTAAYSTAASTTPIPGSAVVMNPEDATRAALLLGLPESAFVDTLIRRSRGSVEGASGSSLSVTWQWKRVADVRAALQSFICNTYAALVQWLVNSVNTALSQCSQHKDAPSEEMYLSIVDGGGLEGAFDESKSQAEFWCQPADLSQLVRNYQAEKAQELYLACIFKADRLVYEAEGIDIPEVPFVDNCGVVELLDDPRTGLLNQLEEANAFPRSTDASLVTKFVSLHKKNPAFVKPADLPSAICDPSHAELMFGIRHADGCVPYSAAGFLAANRDKSDLELCELASGGQHLLSELYASRVVGASSAVSCMADAAAMLQPIALTQPTFIRCFTPNVERKARYIDPSHLMRQLSSSATIAAVQLRHSGFPYKNAFWDFYERYIILAHRGGNLVFPPPPDVPIRELCMQLLAHLVQHPVFSSIDIASSARFGHSKIFLRRQVMDALEALREVRLAAMDRCAARIQATWRGYSQRKHLLQMWDGVRRMQAAWKTLRSRALWLHTRNAAILMQSGIRHWLMRCKFQRMRSAVVRIQAWYKRCSLRRRWTMLRSGLRALHCMARGYIIRCHVMRMLAGVTRIQAAIRRFLARVRVLKVKSAAASKFQSAWRAYRFRIDNEDVLQYLAWRRAERSKHRAVAKLQNKFRARRIQEAYECLRSAALVIQRWYHTLLARRRFVLLRHGARTIQAAVRGYLARQSVRQLKTLQLIGDELWRVAIVRERECVEVIRLREDEVTNAMKPRGGMAAPPSVALDVGALSPTRPTVSAKTPPAAKLLDRRASPSRSGSPHVGIMPFSHSSLGPPTAAYHSPASQANCSNATSSTTFSVNLLLDVDPQIDTSLIYPNSWSKLVAYVEKELKTTGTRIAQIAVGGAHTVILSEAGHVYTFGFSDLGQCGHGRFSSEPNARLVSSLLTERHQATAQLEAAAYVPSHASFASRALASTIRIRAIACGEEHTLALSDQGTVYAWGSGKYGQTGLGITNSVNVPCFVALDIPTEFNDVEAKVADISAGSHHSVALLTSGVVFTWGHKSCIGNGPQEEDAMQPVVVKAIARARIRRIASGPDFVAVVSAAGDVYTWGNNREGQLGLGEDMSKRKHKGQDDAGIGAFVTGKFRPRLTPTMVESLAAFDKHSRIVHIACGGHHCVALSSTGRVFTWGSNSHGQLGMGCIGNVRREVLESHQAPIPEFPLFSDAEHSVGYTPRPWVANPTLVKGLELRHVLCVAAGRRSTFAITDMNEALAWGFTGAPRKQECAGKFLDKAGKTSAEVDVQSSFVLAAMPTEIPIHDVPARALKRIVASHSSSLSVSGVGYNQHQISESQLRDYFTSKAMYNLRVGMREDGELSSVHVAEAQTQEFLQAILNYNGIEERTSSPVSSPPVAERYDARPTPTVQTKPVEVPKPVIQMSSPLRETASRRHLIMHSLVSGTATASSFSPLSSPAANFARDALLTPTRAVPSPGVELSTPPKSRSSVRTSTGDARKKSVHIPESIRPSPPARKIEVAPLQPRTTAALLSIPPCRLQHLDRELVGVLTARLRMHSELTQGEDALVALQRSQRQSVLKRARSSIKLVKSLLGEKSAEILLKSRPEDIPSSEPHGRHSGSSNHQNVASLPRVNVGGAVDIPALLRIAQQEAARRKSLHATVAVVVPRDLDDAISSFSPARKLVAGAVATASKDRQGPTEACADSNSNRIHVGLFPMHQYVAQILSSSAEDAMGTNEPATTTTSAHVDLSTCTAPSATGANLNNTSHLSVRSMLHVAHQRPPAPPTERVGHSDPLASALVRERALEVAALDAGLIHSAAREELSARISELRTQLDDVRVRSTVEQSTPPQQQ